MLDIVGLLLALGGVALVLLRTFTYISEKKSAGEDISNLTDPQTAFLMRFVMVLSLGPMVTLLVFIFPMIREIHIPLTEYAVLSVGIVAFMTCAGMSAIIPPALEAVLRDKRNSAMPLLLSALVVMDVALQEMIVILLYLAYGVIESANQVVGPLPDEWTIIYTVLLPSAALIGTASLIKGLVGHTAMESLGGLTRETYSKVLVKIVMVEPLAFLGFIWALINMPLPL